MTDQADTPLSITPAALRLKAMNLLARREHSRLELAEKLTRKLALDGDGLLVLSGVLDKLIKDDLQSDQRFAEALVRSKVIKGQGPRRIVQALQTRGISKQLAANAVANCGADWRDLAAAVADKKFGCSPVNDEVLKNRSNMQIKEKAKRSRFLQYRGFDAEHIAYALNSARHSL